MKSERIYNAWKEQKSRIEVGSDFSQKVMSRIYRYEQEKPASLFDVNALIEWILSRPFAKAGLVAAATAGGVIRVAFVLCTFLQC
jgi:hypothetical protein